MYRFHVTIQAQGADVQSGEPITLAGKRVTPLRIDPASLAAAILPLSFEAAADQLTRFERLDIEPDGSLVWTSGQGEPAWQLDGNLYDRDGRLLFVDLKGTCPAEAFDRFLAVLGWPNTKLMFQLTREAVFLDEAEFRRFAAEGSNGNR